MDKKEKYLIKNTTRARREEIVRMSLGGDVCSGCAGCEGVGCGNVLEMYKDYIEGKKDEREKAMAESTIPDKIDVEFVNDLLLKIRKEQLGL